MLNDNELLALNGKPGSEELMILDNHAYQKWEFESLVEAGYMPKKLAKQGWKPTHVQMWTWQAQQVSRGGGLQVSLYKTNVSIVPIK